MAELDPRGSDVGLENPYNNGGGGGGSYPSFSDATNSGRCVWEGLALPCEKASRLAGSAGYQASNKFDYETKKMEVKKVENTAIAHESMHDTLQARTLTDTTKPTNEPDKGDAVEPSSIPTEDPTNVVAIVDIPISFDDSLVDASVGLVNTEVGFRPLIPLPEQSEGNCGLNPITNKPGIRNDIPSKKHPAKNAQGTGRAGGLGNIRKGNGGAGGFQERSSDGHDGIDIEAPVGTPVYASLDGVVKRVVDQFKVPGKNGGGYGNLVAINYDNLSLNGVYAHLTTVNVTNGQSVEAGDLIGTTGRTGNANNKNQPSGDDHLHYGRFTGEYEKGSLAGKDFIDPQKSLNSPCP